MANPKSHYLTEHARHVLTIDTVRGQKTLHMRDADLTPLRIDDSSILNQRVRVPLHAPFIHTSWLGSYVQNGYKCISTGSWGCQTHPDTPFDPFPHVGTVAKHGISRGKHQIWPQAVFYTCFPSETGALAAFPYFLQNPLRRSLADVSGWLEYESTGVQIWRFLQKSSFFFRNSSSITLKK